MRLAIIIFILNFSFLFSQSNNEHIVEKGENLYLISKKYNVSLSAIFQRNPQFERAILKVGDVVVIPNVTQEVSNQENNLVDGMHNVVSGDTKFGLAKKYQTTVAELEADNPEIVPMLMVGQKLKIRKSNPVNNTSESQGETELYVVKVGETLWGLSKRYNVSVADLENANKDLLVGILKSGQNIRIPTKNYQKSTYNSDNIHIVKPGETKYGLSKKYNISIAELENLNPQIVKMLVVGQQIVFSKEVGLQEVTSVKNNNTEEKMIGVQKDDKASENELKNSNSPKNIAETNETSKQNINNQNTNKITNISDINTENEYVDYEIKSKETLFGLSKKAKMSKEDFLKLNPILVTDGIKVGKIIKMPKDSVSKDSSLPLNQNDSKETNVSNYTNNTKIVTENKNKNKYHSFDNLDKGLSKTIVFLFNNDEKELENNIVTSESLKFQKQYFEGVNLALDSLKNIGLNLSPIFLNINANEKKSNNWKKSLKKGDLIVGPFEKEHVTEMIKHSNDMSKNIIIPVQTEKFDTDINPIYAIPSKQHLKIFMLDYLSSFKGNMIVVTDFIDNPDTNFIRELYPNVKFAPLDSKGNISIERLKDLLQKNVTNYVILETDKKSLIISSTNFLLNEVNNFSIELALLSERSFLNSSEISSIRYKVLKLKYPIFDFKTSNEISMLKSKYKKLHQQEISLNTIQAFDVTMDAALRLFQKKSIEESFKNEMSKQTQIEFSYKKNNFHFWNSAIKINQF